MLTLSRRILLAGTVALMATAGFIHGASAADPIKVWHHGGRGDGERERMEALIKEWNTKKYC